MMLRRNRAAARVRAPASRPIEIVLSAEARRKFADFIMLLDTAKKRSGVIKNERKKVKLSKTRDGPQSSYFAKATKDVSGLIIFVLTKISASNNLSKITSTILF